MLPRPNTGCDTEEDLMLRGSVEATRDMDAGDEGEVWGREDGLLTGF